MSAQAAATASVTTSGVVKAARCPASITIVRAAGIRAASWRWRTGRTSRSRAVMTTTTGTSTSPIHAVERNLRIALPA
jgi:hypothetical protein